MALLGWAVLPGAGAAASACPNAALRSELRSGQLPDCRAYELVSPVYKEGAIMGTFGVSQEGSRLIVGSFGVFGGAEAGSVLGAGSVPGVAYLLSRTASGWTASALVPPDSLYKSSGMVDAGADLSGTLWELRKRRVLPPGVPQQEVRCPPGAGEEEAQPRGVTDLYLEQPRGTFARVGPATPDPCRPNEAPQYTYLGASASLSHVLFSAQAEVRWPFDGTAAGGTLYEYVGVEQPSETREPSLVGVSGDRGSRALISRCGTRLGSVSPEEEGAGSAYNAISETGARVFFTAVGKDDRACLGGGPSVEPAADELFAREELPLVSGELPTAHMRTVAISEPLREDCGECLTSRERGDAVFRGASQDGSKVFFTTEQELLPAATGANLYEYDFNAPAGGKVSRVSAPLAGEAEVQGVARISEDGSHVYFVARGVLTKAPNGLGNSAKAGEENLYVYERDEQFPAGRTAFVARLSPGDAGDWQRTDERPVLASHDGRFLVFTSGADLTREGLSGGVPQVFQYDASTGGLVRASIGQDGYNDNGAAPFAGSRIVSGFPSSQVYSRVDSPGLASGVQAPADGAVFFESPDALTPQALNDQRDSLNELVTNVYEYRAGSVYLLSDGRDTSTVDFNRGGYLAGSDPSGEDVFFFTSDSLIPQDGSTQQDIYDARVGGGFPTPAPPTACGGEACLGALAGAPALAPLGGSATQVAEAEGSPPPAPLPGATKAKPKVKKKPKGKKKTRGKKRQKAKAGKKAGGSGLHSSVHGRWER